MDKNKKVEISELPKCDFCDHLASYDFNTNLGGWANGCQSHFREFGGQLGLGKGQELVKIGGLQ